MEAQLLIHKWEAQGLGKAPFKCVGMYSLPARSLAEHNPQAYQAELAQMPKGYDIGTCAVCGMALTNNFLIRTGCGRQFSVGCDCVKKAGDVGLVDAVKTRKRAADREKRFLDREAERLARLQAQRERNGGLTDWELQEEQQKIREQAENTLKQQKGQAIQPIVQPVIDALDAKPTPFTTDMVSLLVNGELPEGRALDICRSIYAEDYARKTTGKTRGTHFKSAKEAGRVQAAQWFADAKVILENPTSE